MKKRRRYVAHGVPGGWKIWDGTTQEYWGKPYHNYPHKLILELNGSKRQDKLNLLDREYQSD